MSSSRLPWPTESSSSNHPAVENSFDPSMSAPWMHEGQAMDSYNRAGPYAVNGHAQHHVRNSSIGYGNGFADQSVATYYTHQPPSSAYAAAPPQAPHQAVLDQYALYSNGQQHQQSVPQHQQHQIYQSSSNQLLASSVTETILSRDTLTVAGPPQPTRSTLRFGDLETWMDVNYFNQVSGMMGWRNVIVKIPSVPHENGAGMVGNGKLQPKNPGYVFITFPTADGATAALASLRPPKSIRLMPNSKKAFNAMWATVPSSSARSYSNGSPDPSMTKEQRSMAGLFAAGSLSLLNHKPGPPLQDEVSPSASASRPQEYSIFVGDLAQETTNADLTEVFRSPIRGLRFDREPKYVAPFTSCKSAKIMVDPVMGTSKGYGFVRFGSASDASRALIEMQGLYCESRPMRISQATAKARPQAYAVGLPAEYITRGIGGQQLYPQEYDPYGRSLPPPEPLNHLARPVSGPLDLAISTEPTNNGQPKMQQQQQQPSPDESSRSSPSPLFGANNLPQHHTPANNQQQHNGGNDSLEKALGALSALDIDPDILAQLVRMAVKPSSGGGGGAGGANGVEGGSPGMINNAIALGGPQSAPAANHQFPPDTPYAQRGSTSTGRAHQTVTPASAPARPITITPGAVPTTQQRNQARALLASMVGPNGAVQNSADPYNTTVFVGGLSGLIAEDTLRTFFGEYGQIHYVKIPPGKGCGFVQFVRKADAEAAISGLQGFPIGGGRVRLSWGRSQSDKAAQAAAQAAQLGINIGQLGSLQGLSEDHKAQLLQSLGIPAGSVTGSSDTVIGQPRDSYSQGPSMPSYGMDSVQAHDGYIGRGVTSSSSTTPGGQELSDMGTHISRSHTFPSFAPFGSDAGSYGGVTNMASARSVAGMSALQPAQVPTRYQLSSQGSGNISNGYGRDGGGIQNGGGSGGYASYHETGQIGGSSSRQGGYTGSSLIRSERSGSDSTTCTTQTDPRSLSTNDGGSGDGVYDMSNTFAGMNFGQDGSDDYAQDANQYQHHINGTYHPSTK